MAYTRTDAVKLLTAAEMVLFDAARRDSIGSLTTRALKAKIERTRRLRDKYRDLFKRQRLDTRARTGTKLGRSGAANQRTKEKAALLAEVLERYEARLAQVEAAEKRAALKAAQARAKAERAAAAKAAAKARAAEAKRRPAKSPKAPAAKPVASASPLGPVGRTGFMNPRAKGIETKRQLHRSRGTVIHAHLRAAGRRNQAKRDRR